MEHDLLVDTNRADMPGTERNRVMGLMARDSGGEGFDPVEAGVHNALCFAVYDLGTHHSIGQGWDKMVRKVLIMWELSDLRIEIDGKDLPRAISNRYTLTLHEKGKLRGDLEGWRGQPFTQEQLDGFDLRNLLGAGCQLQVIHEPGKNGKTYANIKTIIPAPKGGAKVVCENEHKFFCFEDDGANLPDGMPEWVQKIIRESAEWGELIQGSIEPDEGHDMDSTDSPPEFPDEECPF